VGAPSEGEDEVMSLVVCVLEGCLRDGERILVLSSSETRVILLIPTGVKSAVD
jgi:hypothetical protein